MSDTFQAEGEIQFLYDSLKSTFQKSTSDNTILESERSTTSSEDIPDAIRPVQQIPVPAPPEPPARRPREPRPPPPPREHSTRTAKPTTKVTNNPDFNKLLRRPNQSNTVPFPTDTEDAELGTSSDPGGITVDDNAELNETANVASGEEPQTHQQAMQSPDFSKWHEAELYELEMINRLGTCKLIKLPKGRKPVGCKWVYKIKRDICRAPIVAQGFSQRPAIDYLETFAPVAKIESVRILLAIAAILDWEVHIIDVDSAFLNSELPSDPEVFLEQPPCYVVEGKEDYVWLLLKGPQSLLQTSR
jgi:hypothetical protein